MSEVITTSTGIKVWVSGDDRLFTVGEDLEGHRYTQAVREFFQDERDREVGRERDPENNDYVVYRIESADEAVAGRCVRVVSEATGMVQMVWEANVRERIDPTLPERVALRYFDAHPLAWFAAKPGEVWVITINTTEIPALVTQDVVNGSVGFKTAYCQYQATDPNITAGRRVWSKAGAENNG